jgi:hypothetical protein
MSVKDTQFVKANGSGKMKSEAEIALEVTLEMVVEMCDKDLELAKSGGVAFANTMRKMAQRGLDNAKNARKMCSLTCTVK